MTDNEDSLERSDQEKQIIEEAKRVVRRIEKTQNAPPFMYTGGTLTHDAIMHLASSLARLERTLSREPIAHDSRDLVIDDLIQRVDRQSRRIDSLELDIVALRSAQQLADPIGASPYRSPLTSATAKPRDRVYVPAEHPDYPYAVAPSSPVAASDALGRPETRPGVLRRVYGALASLAPVLSPDTWAAPLCILSVAALAVAGFAALLARIWS